jgi:hypothetical protein
LLHSLSVAHHEELRAKGPELMKTLRGVLGRMKLSNELKKLGDFTTTSRVLPIAGLAMAIGSLARTLRLRCCG